MSTTSTGAEAPKDFLSNDQVRASSPTELDIRVELITPKIAKRNGSATTSTTATRK